MGYGRDPFPHVVEKACMLSTGGDWFLLIENNWQIGDNVEFPSHILYVREVNHQMVNFIVKHFGGILQSTVSIRPSTLQDLGLTS